MVYYNKLIQKPKKYEVLLIIGIRFIYIHYIQKLGILARNNFS